MSHNLKSSLARTKYRFFIGTGFAGIITGIAGLLTFAKVWVETFVYFNIPPAVAYISIPAFWIAFCYYSGAAYELSGVQALEISHQNQNVNPEVLILLANGKQALDKLDKMNQNMYYLQCDVNEFKRLVKP